MNSSNHGYIWFEKLECQRGQKMRSRKFNNIWRRALCSVTLSNSLLSCSLLWQKLGNHPGRQTSKTVKTKNQRSLTNLLISHVLAHFCHMYFSDSLMYISLILLCDILWTCPKTAKTRNQQSLTNLLISQSGTPPAILVKLFRANSHRPE